MVDVEKAKEYLKEEITCVFVKDEEVFTSNQKGISPLFLLSKQIKDTNEYSVADKIVGKAAAMLFVKFGIKEVYGELMSVSGKAILEKYNINYTYGNLVDNIINRKGDDICPMEKTIFNVDDIDIAYKLLKEKNESLN